MIAFHLLFSIFYFMTTVSCAIIENESKILIARRVPTPIDRSCISLTGVVTLKGRSEGAVGRSL